MEPVKNIVDWKIIYKEYQGVAKRAIEFLNKELGALLLRKKGVYTVYTLDLEKYPSSIDKNAIIVGKYDDMKIISRYVDRNEVPNNGYFVKVFDNSENKKYKICIITANDDVNLYYGALDFVDRYLPNAAPLHGGDKMYDEVFLEHLPDYENSSYPRIKTRSVFCWGHTIDDLDSYIENLARMKINQVIVWNDFIPVNAKEFVEVAHSYGIEVMWGFAWGWKTNCTKIDIKALDKLKDSILKKYFEEYDGQGDGIYFQSFTELKEDRIDGVLIAEAVTDFVNKTAGELFVLRPNLKIQFGLHAISVKDHIEYFKKIDPRIEILWEDCGCFPYHYVAEVESENDYIKTEKFTENIISQRNKKNIGVVYKGMTTLDWTKFVHQSGPFILGHNSKKLMEIDLDILKPIWKTFQSQWLVSGEYVHRMTNKIMKLTGGNINITIVANLNGGLWFPPTLCSEILWNCERPYQQILREVSNRHDVDFV